MKLSFFDLDHTLLSKNSGVLYALFARRSGRISRLSLLRSLRWAFLHRLGRLDVDTAYAKAGALFRGISGEELRHETQRWFRRDAMRYLRPGAAHVLDEHRRAGEVSVLLTNSSSFIAEAACAALGLDAWLANEILLDAYSLITGEVPRPLCYGSGKLVHAQAFAQKHGAELSKASFYTDSISDLPMLCAVARPVAVHPDRRLRRVARQRGIPIVDWS